MMQYRSDFDPGRADAAADTAIAIVGMSCRFAGVRGLDEYWDLLREGREGVETFDEEALRAAGVPPAMLRKSNYVRRGAPLADMECFDAALFGLSPRDAAVMDPQHRHFLECTWEALENAGHVPQRFDGAIGVFAGSGHNAYMPYHLLTNPKLVRDVGLFLLRHTGNDKDFLTTRVSYLLDLTGPSINVQTACSTSLVAMHMAAQSLLSGECDMAIAGGASIELPHRQGYVFEEGEILSSDGHCRPFDAQSNGTVFGSGVAVLVLRRLADAVEAGDHIYAVLRGSAINNDGAGKVGYLAPSVDGQARVIAEALAIADVDADTIGYVEAHGTGTPVGDPIEIAALTQAFRETSTAAGTCRIGSVKGNIGHTDTAAGAAGVIKVALALHHQALPPSLNFTAPNPDCAFDGSPFVVQSHLTPWPAGGAPRRAGISSLGVGGTNAHVVVEEAPPRVGSTPARETQLLLVSARSPSALAANADALAGHFAAHPGTAIADAAYTLSVGRQHLAQRRFAVAASTAEASEALRAEATRTAAAPPCIPDRPVAFLFCGAGAQHADMARRLYDTEAAFRASVDAALGVLDRIGVHDIRRWLFPIEAERDEANRAMERPSIALPILFTIQVALARLWMSLGIRPSGMIGHSSGEYAAAHIAGVIDLEAGLRIVSARGRLFETMENGGMLSVPIAETDLVPLLPPGLSIAAINAPRLCVVSGPSDAIAGLQADLAEREIEAQLVRISVAAHSPLLDPILPQFRALMETIALHPPRLPFVSNLTGDWVSDAEATSADYWVRHLRQTVRFTDGLQRLLGEADRVLLEVGPGRAMASLVRQHPERPRDQPVLSSLPHPDQPIADDRFFWSSLGQLWTLGVTVDWDAYWHSDRRLRIPLPTYRFDRERHWIEPGALTASGPLDGEPLDRREDVGDWFYEQVWTRAPRLPAIVPEGPALIFADDAPLAAAIADRLRAAGRAVVLVRSGNRFRQEASDRFRLDPGSACQYSQLFDQLSAADRLPTQIYHCWGLTGSAQSTTDRMIERGLFSLTAMVPQLARQAGEAPVAVALLTDRAHRIAGGGDILPAKACAIGAARVISTEYPGIALHPIDVPASAGEARILGERARDVIAELAAKSDGRPICHRGGDRWQLEPRVIEPVDADPAAIPAIRTGATYLITGGLGGIGLSIARHLASQGARIALVTRNAVPPREEWPDLITGDADARLADRIRKLLAIEATGAAVQLVTADVADTRAMTRAVREIRSSSGPIAGVFHTAGTLDDGLLENRTRPAMEAVLRPKVAGTLALERALVRERPDFILLFSSISAIAGLAGQADYAAANAFLDAYAASRRDDPDSRVISIGWSQWCEVGMAASLGDCGSSASALPDVLDDGVDVDHPFLHRLHAVSDDVYVAAATLSPERHWLLDEHRLEGVGPLIPGTGYLELVRAAHALIDPGPSVLSDIVFAAPFAVGDGAARDLRVHLQRRSGADWRFTVLGRATGEGGWTDHASGIVRTLHDAKQPVALDLAAIEARCPVVTAGAAGTSHVLTFGPRWDNVAQTAIGVDEAMVRLALPPAFARDLDSIDLHPALLDLATAGAQQLIPGHDPARDFFAPFSYRRLALHAALPARIVSHIRYRGPAESGAATAAFDVTLADSQGNIVATIAEFTMIRVRDPRRLSAQSGADRAPSDRAPTAPAERLDGILPEQGLDVLCRLLASPPRAHVLVSPYDLESAIARLRAPRRAPVRSANADGTDAADLPQTAMEQVIAGLWEDLLGMSPVRRTDNFFDLGGHSLLAVQFVNRFRKQTGKTLALAALLDTATVENLARIVDPNGAPAEAAQAATADARHEVVTIRSGGDSTPIFFVHDGLGETLLYRGLALRLDTAHSVYGIEPRRNAADGFAHTRIDEMAADYVARIRDVQPHGPYLIAGLCAGGVIAFEMARQLQDQGERVAFVGVIDAADVAAAKRSFYVTRLRLARLAPLLRQSASLSLLPALVRRGVNALAWEAGSRIRRWRDQRTVRRIEGANAAPAGIPAAAPAIGFLQLYEVAHRAHRPSGLFAGGEVTLFKASGGNGAIEDIPYQEIYADFALGWGRRVQGDIIVAAVPGGHGSALQEPNVGTLARQFQNAIDSAMDKETVAERGADPDTALPPQLLAAAE